MIDDGNAQRFRKYFIKLQWLYFKRCKLNMQPAYKFITIKLVSWSVKESHFLSFCVWLKNSNSVLFLTAL